MHQRIVVSKFAMGFIAFVNRFKSRKKITLIEEMSETIIFNTILKSLDKRAQFENIIDIFIVFAYKYSKYL